MNVKARGTGTGSPAPSAPAPTLRNTALIERPQDCQPPGTQTLTESSALDGRRALASWVIRAGACFVAVLVAVTDVSAEQNGDEVKTEGGWAYTSRESEGATEYMATVQAEEGSTWLLLACRPDKRFTVSLINTGQFPFALKPSSPVELRSNSVPSFTIEGKSIQSNLIFVDPRLLRHVMPMIVQDDQLSVTVSDLNGTAHVYTFSMQPNDIALEPFRSGCFD
jgi:hypothetical protein